MDGRGHFTQHDDANTATVASMGLGTTSFEGITLSRTTVKHGRDGGPVAGATARVEAAADVERRITATRLLTVGVFALAWKKKQGSVFLTVSHPTYELMVAVPVKKETDARKFAAKSTPRQGEADTGGAVTNTSWSGRRRAFPTAMRAAILRRHPTCNQCGRAPSTIADHILNHAECLRRGIEPDTLANGQGLCVDCHDAKTRTERLAGIKAQPRARRAPERHPGLRFP